MLSETRLQGLFTLSGVSTSLRRLFAKNRDNECNRDLTPIYPFQTLPNPRLSLTCLRFRHSMLAHDRRNHLALPHR